MLPALCIQSSPICEFYVSLKKDGAERRVALRFQRSEKIKAGTGKDKRPEDEKEKEKRLH